MIQQFCGMGGVKVLHNRRSAGGRLIAGLAIVAVITLLLSLLLIFVTGYYVENDYRQISDAVLRQSIQATDTVLESLDQMTSEFILENNNINQFFTQANVIGFEEYKMKLSLDRFYDSLVYRYGSAVSLYIYAPNTNRIYLNGAMYTADFMENTEWLGDVLNIENTNAWVRRDNMQVYHGYGKLCSRTVLVNKRTFPLSTVRATGVVVTLMDEDYLNEFLIKSLPSAHAQYYVLGPDNQITLSVGAEKGKYMLSAANHIPQDRQLLSMPFKPRFYQMVSDYTGWRYVLRISGSGLFSIYSPIGFFYAFAVILYCIFVAAFLVMLFARPYRTVVEIIKQMRKYTEDLDTPLETDEFLYLRSVFEKLKYQVEGLAKQVENYRPAMCRQLILEMMHVNSIPSYPKHIEKLRMAGLEFYQASFCVAVLQHSHHAEHNINDRIVVERIMPVRDGLMHPLSASRESGGVVLLLTAREWLEQERFADYAKRCLTLLSGNEFWCAGVGTPVSSFEEIPRSYREAQIALNQSLLSENGVLTTFTEPVLMGFNDKKLIQVSREMEAILNINREDYIQTLPELLCTLFARMETQRFSVALLQLICNQLIYRALELAAKYDVSIDGLTSKYPQGVLNALSGAWKMKKCEQVLEDVFMQLHTQWMNKNNQAGSSRLAKRIEQYLRENYRDPNLSASVLVDEFSVTAQHISRSFSSYMGMTLQSYLTMLRIEEAKWLLIHEKKTNLLTVAQQCGYTNQQTFAHAFRKETGSSPGAYRESYFVPRSADL